MDVLQFFVERRKTRMRRHISTATGGVPRQVVFGREMWAQTLGNARVAAADRVRLHHYRAVLDRRQTLDDAAGREAGGQAWLASAERP